MHSVRIGKAAVAACLGLLAWVTVAVAGPEGRPSGSRRAPGGPERPEEMRRAMEQMVIARMAEALHLTEAQEAAVIPRFEELTQARRDHAAKRRAAMLRLRSLLLDETASDQEIDRALKEVRTLEEDFRHREGELRSALDEGLTNRQQARLVFFEERIRRVMQRRLREATGEGAVRGPGRGRGPASGRQPPGPSEGDPVREDWAEAPEDDL